MGHKLMILAKRKVELFKSFVSLYSTFIRHGFLEFKFPLAPCCFYWVVWRLQMHLFLLFTYVLCRKQFLFLFRNYNAVIFFSPVLGIGIIIQTISLTKKP